MFDTSVFIDEIIIKKGEDFPSYKDRDLCIAMYYIFESKDIRDAVYEAIKKANVESVDARKYLAEGFDIDKAQENMKKAGVEEYILVDGTEVEKVDADKASRSIVTAMKFKTKAHKKLFMNMFKLAKKYGVIQ